jgi:hypothetical protein
MMTVIYSDKLSEIVDAKIASDLLKQVKKTSFYHEIYQGSVHVFKHEGAALHLLVAMADKHGLPCDFTVASTVKSTRRAWVFVFDCDEPTAIARAQAVKRGSVAPKVKVRMVADRLIKAAGYVEGQHDRPNLTREMLTPKGFEAYLDKCNRRRFNNDVPWWIADVKKMVDREDFDESVYDEAWQLFKVQQVMAS